MNQDWKGDSNSVFKTMGASSHCLETRQNEDFYATSPKAIDILCGVEKFDLDIWECSCVDSETEFFNGTFWKRISEYASTDMVLQYNKNGLANLVQPIKYHKTKADFLYRYKNKNLDMCLSEDHRVIYKHRRTEKLLELPFHKVLSMYNSDSNGFRGKIITSFKHEGDLCVNEYWLRLAVACNADGRIRSRTNYCEMRFKKDRKKDRLIYLLEKANIEYTYKINSSGYHAIYFYSPLGCKKFPEEWFNLTLYLKECIIDEIKYWDSSIVEDGTFTYSTSKKYDFDFIQMLCHSIGKSTTVQLDNRAENTNYRITPIRKTASCLSKNKKTTMNKVSTSDGNQYCFTVPSGMLILRRNNKIFITGNCGQGHLSKRLEDFGYSVISTDLIDRGYGIPNIDFLKETKTRARNIITNPPYSFAMEFTEHALSLLEDGSKLALFLKLTFLEGKKRKKLFLENPPKTIYVSSSRIHCGKNGDFTKINETGSAVAYAWYVWEKGWKGDSIVKWVN